MKRYITAEGFPPRGSMVGKIPAPERFNLLKVVLRLGTVPLKGQNTAQIYQADEKFC